MTLRIKTKLKKKIISNLREFLHIRTPTLRFIG